MPSVALSIPVAGSVTLALHQNNYATIQTAINALDTVNYVDGSVTRPKLATVTRKAQLSLDQATTTLWPDAASTTSDYFFVVPDDYVSGDLTVKVQVRSNVTGNQFRIRRNTYRFRDGVALAAVDANVDANLAISATANASQIYSFTFTAANFQAGDVLRFSVARLGADANDTNTGQGDVDGAWVEYTGRS